MIHTLLAVASILATGCVPRAQLVADLDRYGYAIVGDGPVDGGQLLVEIYVDESGNWLAVLTRAADQLACIKASGTDWRTEPTGEAA